MGGSSSTILGPGEAAVLSSLRLQWPGDPNTAPDATARFELWVNGVPVHNSGRTITRDLSQVGSFSDYALDFFESYRLRAGDTFTVRRVPHNGNPPEADIAMTTTWFLDIEKD